MTDSSRLEELKRRVQRDPASISFAALAEEYRKLGLFAEAIETCRAGLLRHPAYISARVTLGRALVEIGEFDEASVELEQVLRSAPENLEYLKAARLEFEIALVRKAAGRAREDDVVHLEHRIAAMRTAGSGLAFLRADMQFHRAIAELSGNPLYPLLLEAVLDWLSAFHVAQVHVSGLEALTIDEHEAIVAAIARGDTSAAAEAVRAHLTRANALYRLHER